MDATLEAAKARCERTRWPEHHPDDCAWCAHVLAERGPLIEPGWNATAQAHVVKVTENWVVAVVPMIYNDRVLLMRPDELATGWTAGFCYDKGGAAHLAALAWDPETDQYPVGFKKIAGDAR